MRAPTAFVLLAAGALAACQKAAEPEAQTEAVQAEETAGPQAAEVPPPEPLSREAVQQAEQLLPEGSSRDAVLKLLGEPVSKEGEVWKYGFNYTDADIAIRVAFDSDGKVSNVKMIFDPLCM